jgi:hypothetical protein
LCARFAEAKGHRDNTATRLATVQKEIRDLEAEDELLTLVGELFRTLIDTEVTESVQVVERLLTEGLQAVFEDMDLQVKAQVELQRGKVAVDLVTIQTQPDGTVTEGDSTDAYGGSVSTMESVLLRIIVILRRDLRPMLLLDESLGAVADQYVPNVGRFLSLLCARLGMDVLAVTHNATLVEAADKAYRIRKVGGAATFREVTG